VNWDHISLSRRCNEIETRTGRSYYLTKGNKMKYEDALREWGARRLEGLYGKDLIVDRSTVTVDMEFDEGYACCGGSDPNCYCSFAESPRASVEISGKAINPKTGELYKKGMPYIYNINHYDWDFAKILGEIVDASGGQITK
jgi:uncharacterized protein (DUF779 family)